MKVNSYKLILIDLSVDTLLIVKMFSVASFQLGN